MPVHQRSQSRKQRCAAVCIVTLLFLGMLLPCATFAQSQQPAITLVIGRENLDVAMLRLERASGIAFVYDAAELGKYKVGPRNYKNMPVYAVLTDLFTDKPFAFKQEGKQVIVYRKALSAQSLNSLPAQHMHVDTLQLGPVVVTALGLSRAQRSVGYAVTTLSNADVNTVKTPNLINALTAKVPGVQIRSMSPDPASSAFIVIRGESSLAGNSQPLFVIDGIPVQAGASIGGNVDYGNIISDINTDDIAEVTVLKGAGAAALYGSRAGNGVILITTKSGSGSKNGLGVSVSSAAMFDRAWQFPQFQNAYGAGSDLYATDTWGEAAWGAKLNDGSKRVQWNSPVDENGNFIPTDWVAYPNRVRDFFRTGQTYTNNIAVESGPGARGNFRLSYTDIHNLGVIPNTEMHKTSVNISAGYHVTRDVNVNVSMMYNSSGSDNRFSGDRNGVINTLYTTSPNVDVQQLRNYWKPGREGREQLTHLRDIASGKALVDNPYFIAYEQTNAFERNRLNGMGQLNYRMGRHFKLMLRTGVDQYVESRWSRKPFSTVNYPEGYYSSTDIFFRELNTDFLLTFDKTLRRNWSMSVSAGGNRMDRRHSGNTVTASKLVVPELYTVTNGASGSVQYDPFFFRKRINSLYITGQLAYGRSFFVDLSARNDWSSTLPSRHNAFLYPALSVSAIVSELLHLEPDGVLSFAKLRANVAQVGKDTDPYNLYNTFSFITDWGDLKRAEMETLMKNNKLKPEINTSLEVGADLRFFQNRLGVDVSYYRNGNRNQIIPIPTASSSGVTEKIINAGNIRTSGIEVQLTGTPVKGPLTWHTTVNYTRSREKVIALAPELIDGEIYLSGGEWTKILARPGGRMGDMYGEIYRVIPDGPNKGQPWLSDNGEYMLLGDNFQYYGNYNPDFMVGFSNNFNWGNFNLNFLLDYRQGGVFYSYTANNLQSDGRVVITLPGRGAENGGIAWTDDQGRQRHDGMLLAGFIQNADGSFRPNDVVIGPESYYPNYYWDYPARNSYSATYVKLRELACGYTFHQPFRFVEKIGITLTARNLFSWTAARNGYDPETSNKISGGRYNLGINTWTLPAIRSYGLKLDVNF
ncbi:SusC/RagA family TonB-linked outer membrane protein [Chitinophaga horti]|uniref:SusC/RagA family TonB-linked outer membrane protein n=1 Tax=Chitinophaga horti TaxID=2920382 RepID=A0ABY6IZS2_9BACT|nr:SusC/RagA family TonB-linked outer membrane protein [Chitinophaga horti]UYQ91897.1 SusC/RagA family TonB-linked outer membrane protein [Chitinophaga horti]